MKIMYYDVENGSSVMEIDGELETMQKLVGGYIEVVNLSDYVVLIYNEEGRMLGLPINKYIQNFVWFTIVGNCFICRVNGGEFDSLTDDDIKDIKILEGYSNNG